MAEIKVEQVAKTFGSFAAVRGVNFTVDHGSFFVILGPSGCGKTTTLRMMAGLELPTSPRCPLRRATLPLCSSCLRSIRT